MRESVASVAIAKQNDSIKESIRESKTEINHLTDEISKINDGNLYMKESVASCIQKTIEEAVAKENDCIKELIQESKIAINHLTDEISKINGSNLRQ